MDKEFASFPEENKTSTQESSSPTENQAQGSLNTEDLFHPLQKDLKEIQSLILCYLQLQIDRFRYFVRDAFKILILSVSVSILLIGLVFLGMTFAFYGIAQGIGELLDHAWLGYFLSGILILAIFSFFTLYFIPQKIENGLRKKVKYYEQFFSKFSE